MVDGLITPAWKTPDKRTKDGNPILFLPSPGHSLAIKKVSVPSNPRASKRQAGRRMLPAYEQQITKKETCHA
jgi:hypothetical protein